MNLDLKEKTDEDFFEKLERNRNNLGKLFGIELNANDELHTLKYQPPKKSMLAGVGQVQHVWNTQLAKVATAFKQGEPMGKVGVALMQNIEGEAKLIIYKTKTNVLATCTVYSAESKCAQLHKQSRFLQFYDDDASYWCLYFDKESDEQEFLAALKEYGVQVNEKGINEVGVEKQLTGPSKEVVEKIGEHKTAEKEESGTGKAAAKDKHSKSALITRLAKVGQQLPLPTPILTPIETLDFTDSSDTEVITTPLAAREDKPAITPRGKLQTKGQILQVSNMSLFSGTTSANNAVETQLVQMLLTENRTQNTEMRINMSKLEGKVEKVLDRIDVLQSKASKAISDREEEFLDLEEKLLEVKKENRKLKQALNDIDGVGPSWQSILEPYKKDLDDLGLSQGDDLGQLVADLLNRLTAERLSLEKQTQELAAKSQQLEQQEAHLKTEKEKNVEAAETLKELETKVKTLQDSLEDKAKSMDDLQRQLLEQADGHVAQLLQQTEQIQGQEQSIADLEDQLLKQGKLHADQIQDHLEQNAELQRQLDEKTELLNTQMQQQKELIESVLKSIMNNLYSSLATKVENSNNMQKNAVIAVIGKTIRDETLKAVKDIKS